MPTSHRRWGQLRPLARTAQFDVPDMEKGGVGGAVRLIHWKQPQLPPPAPRLHSRLMPSPIDEGPCSFRTGNFTEAEKILAAWSWRNTFRLDCTALGKPIGPEIKHRTFEHCLGQPMEQRVPDTCALVACTVCVEAVHRLKHDDKEEGTTTTTSKFRAAAPDSWLLPECRLSGIWTPANGAKVDDVLTKIHKMGGVPAAATTFDDDDAPPPCVRLRSWQMHRWNGVSDDGGGLLLSPERVAALLDRHGPCVGVLWACPWYSCFDAARDAALVYRGCGRSEDDRRKSKELYDGVGWHAVVCFAYRFICCAGGDQNQNQMHVLVLDNREATGPRRWVDVEELDTLYTIDI